MRVWWWIEIKMTRFCVEDTLIEELKEQELNATVLLQERAAKYKKSKIDELIEECDLIYRLSRTPERRVFYIDTGHLPNHRAMAYLERIKNEIKQ